MTHTLWFYDNTVATPTTQEDIGAWNVTVNGGILAASVHGMLSERSDTPTPAYVIAGDYLWGLQWVAHGASPLSLLTSATDDHWLWRHAVPQNNDVTRAWGPQSTTSDVQNTYSTVEKYRGQGIRQLGSIDVYVSFVSMFGAVLNPYLVIGSVDFYFS
jgi:hypothetical protein